MIINFAGRPPRAGSGEARAEPAQGRKGGGLLLGNEHLPNSRNPWDEEFSDNKLSRAFARIDFSVTRALRPRSERAVEKVTLALPGE
jgi:hypothetical protein